MVAGAVRAEESPAAAPDPDAVLRAALPENGMPELKEVLSKAMADAPRIISAGLDLELARTNVMRNRAPMLPSVSAGINFGYFARQNVNTYGNSTTVDSNGVVTTIPGYHSDSISAGPITTYSVGANQPLYQWGALKKQYQASQLQHKISQRNLEESRRLLSLDVRRAYFNLIIAADARELADKLLVKLEKELDYQKQQQADGFVTASAVSVAESAVIAQKEQIQRLKNSYDSQWETFNQLTSVQSLQRESFKREIPPVAKDVGPVLDRLSKSAEGYRSSTLLNFDDYVRAEELNYDVQKARLRPKLNLSLGAYQDTESPTKRTDTPEVLVRDFRAMANVNWQLFDGFTTQALKQESRARQRQYRNNRDQAEHDYREALKACVETLRLNWASVQRTEDSLTGARDNLAVVQKDFESGMVPKAALDTAQTLLDNSYQSALNVRSDYYLQIASYLSLRGKDPAVNYTSGK